MLDTVVYVVGNAPPDRNPAVRIFPLVKREVGQSEAAHLERIIQLIDQAMEAGGTHLRVPRELANWLGDNPLVVDYFAEHHDLSEASPEIGIVFKLCPGQSMAPPSKGAMPDSVSMEGPDAHLTTLKAEQVNEMDEMLLAPEQPREGRINPAAFPLEFEPWTYRALHSDLWFLTDEQLHEHYRAQGRAEGRRAHPLAQREQFRDLALPAASILEIAPFFRPLFTGPHVAYFDVLDRQGLLDHARELDFEGVDVPEIDYVAATGDLSVINRKFDVVASSHAIEHQPNLVRHLQQVEALLRTGGYYFLFVPDKRYCFDHFISESTIADVIEAAIEGREFHSVRTLIRQQVLVTHNEPVRHWQGDHGEPTQLDAGSVQTAVRVYREALETGRYLDRHAWQFTPDSFRALLQLLNDLGMIALRPMRIYDTLAGSHEFWAILHKPHGETLAPRRSDAAADHDQSPCDRPPAEVSSTRHSFAEPERQTQSRKNRVSRPRRRVGNSLVLASSRVPGLLRQPRFAG